jgi:hypothetical protein
MPSHLENFIVRLVEQFAQVESCVTRGQPVLCIALNCTLLVYSYTSNALRRTISWV